MARAGCAVQGSGQQAAGAGLRAAPSQHGPLGSDAAPGELLSSARHTEVSGM